MTCSSRVMKDLRNGKKKPLDKTSLDWLAILGYLFDHFYVLYLFFRNISFVFIFLVYWIMYTYFFIFLIFVLCNFEQLYFHFVLDHSECVYATCLVLLRMWKYVRFKLFSDVLTNGYKQRAEWLKVPIFYFFIIAFKNNDLWYQNIKSTKVRAKIPSLTAFLCLVQRFPSAQKQHFTSNSESIFILGWNIVCMS